MKRFILTMCALSCAALMLYGCTYKETYPKDKVKESIMKMCKEEYSIETVNVKISGATIAVWFPVEKLFNFTNGLDEQAMEKFQDVLLSVRRVCMSSNASLDFYTVVASDQKMGIELVVSSFITDIKKAMFWIISQSDMLERMSLSTRADTYLLGKKRIEQFFSDLAKNNAKAIFPNNFTPGITLKDISSYFFLTLFEHKLMAWRHFEIIEMKHKAVSEDSALFYVRVKETYDPLPQFKDKKFSYPSGFIHEYLFDIYVIPNLYSPGIKSIYNLNKADDEGKPVMLNFPKEYYQYSNVWDYPARDFYLKEINFKDFLANQIAQRIRKELISIFKDIKTATLLIEPSTDESAMLKFKFMLLGEEESKLKTISEIASRVTKDVCSKYDYKDFNTLSLMSQNGKEFYHQDKIN